MMQRETQDMSSTVAAPEAVPGLETMVRWLKNKKLETPATLFLEMHRPLMPLAYPAALMVGPFIAPFFGPEYYDRVKALSDPKTLDRLLNKISTREPTGPQRVDTPDGLL